MGVGGLTLPMPVPSPEKSGEGIKNDNLTIYVSSVSYIAEGFKWQISEIVNIPWFIVHNYITTQTVYLRFYP
jgi:hypothetical protein